MPSKKTKNNNRLRGKKGITNKREKGGKKAQRFQNGKGGIASGIENSPLRGLGTLGAGVQRQMSFASMCRGLPPRPPVSEGGRPALPGPLLLVAEEAPPALLPPSLMLVLRACC